MEGPFYLVTAPISEQPTFLLGLNVVYTSTLGFVQAVFRFVGGVLLEVVYFCLRLKGLCF